MTFIAVQAGESLLRPAPQWKFQVPNPPKVDDKANPAHRLLTILLIHVGNDLFMSVKLDVTDWRIIRELSANGRITNVQLAQRVGITPPPCLRRVRALEQAGLIRGYHADIDQTALGYEITVFVMIALHSQSEADLRAFENSTLAWPLVRECYMMSGETDYFLKCIAPSMNVFQDFLINRLSATPNVASVKTAVTIRKTKHEPGVPIDDRP